MLANPSVIKRPLLDRNGVFSAGFKPELYDSIFSAKR
jgi:arsenate reductase-like glutaredoxin family protein